MSDHRPADPLFAAFAEYAAKRWGREEWSQFGRDTGTSDILNAHPRLYRSLGFGDDDYPEAVWSIVPRVVPEAAASERLGDQLQLVAHFVPDLFDWVQGPDASPRTKKRFVGLLREHPDELPEEWASPEGGAPAQNVSARRSQPAAIPARVERLSSGEGVISSPEPSVARASSEPAGPKLGESAAPSIFLVHGRDIPAVHEIQVFVQQLTGVMPESLADEPGRGDTIIEKFERRANQATFAIVLLTPDDVGRAVTEADLRSRARQNVILELGYFIAKLGRPRVAVLNAGVERPSDIDGVNYIAYPGDNWKWTLQQELSAAGFTR